MAEDILFSRTDRRTLARNVVLNLVGQGVPLLAALVAIPGLLHALGTERLGVLTLAWLVVGYFTLFDFGIGRALTKLVAERLNTATLAEVRNLVWAALALLTAIGMLAAVVLAGLSGWLASVALKIPANLQAEATGAFQVLAATIPFVIATSALRGVLEAQQRFGIVNAIRVPLGILTFLGPWAAVLFTHRLPGIVLVLAALRVAVWIAHLYFCAPVLPRRGNFGLRFDSVCALFRLGTWMTVSNVVGPLMVYLDRFLIGAMVSMAAVAYYATPYEIVTKLWLLPAAVTGVLFPAFAVHLRDNPVEAGRLFLSGLKWVFLGVFPLGLLFVTFAPEGLTLWLGGGFASKSAAVLQILTVGVLLNCVAQIPFAFVQAAGRPDLTAKIHLLELPVYLAGVYWLIGRYGIEGAAIAWLSRVGVDLVILLTLSGKWLQGTGYVRLWISVAVPTLALLLAGMALRSTSVKVAYAAAVIGMLAFVVWRFFLSPGEKRFLLQPSRAFREGNPQA